MGVELQENKQNKLRCILRDFRVILYKWMARAIEELREGPPW